MDNLKKVLAGVAIPALSAVLTVLLIIPGNQGENIIQLALDVLKKIVAGN